MGLGHGHGSGGASAGGQASAGYGHGGSEAELAVSGAGRHRWRLLVAFCLVGGFFGIELAAGLISGSLALLSDAGHMAADVTTLGAALVATRLATRPDSSGRRTFGRYRAEIFASGFAVLVMLGVAIYIAIEALDRIGQTAEVSSGVMFWVGGIGLAINIITVCLLRSGANDSLNVKGAYLEVLADTLGSAGVIAAALLVSWTGNAIWDTAIALAIAIFVAVRAIVLGREVLRVLGQHAPAGVNPSDIESALAEVDGVDEVHDLHVWTLTSGMDVATAHLVVNAAETEAVLDEASTVLRSRFGIAHATLQIEPRDRSACAAATW